MPETNIKAAAMLGVEPDRQNNVLRLRFRDPSNNVYTLDLGESMIGGLTAALTSRLQCDPYSSGQFSRAT
jgi:hypothetical protein